jgi:hypothetical protein
VNWFEAVVLIFIIWGGSSFALSLSQIKRDVEHIKAMLLRQEAERMR